MARIPVGGRADRLLTPGRWIGAEKGHRPLRLRRSLSWSLAQNQGATCVLCIDHRWLTRIEGHMDMRWTLEGAGVPVALVLGNVGDPLARPGAVDGMVALTRVIDDLSILRCDHGAIGALAFSAAHGSIGLLATHRHGVPPTASARGKPHDQTARVFRLGSYGLVHGRHDRWLVHLQDHSHLRLCLLQRGPILIGFSTLGSKPRPIGTTATCWAVWPVEFLIFPKWASAAGPLDSYAQTPSIATASWAASPPRSGQSPSSNSGLRTPNRQPALVGELRLPPAIHAWYTHLSWLRCQELRDAAWIPHCHANTQQPRPIKCGAANPWDRGRRSFPQGDPFEYRRSSTNATDRSGQRPVAH